MKMCVFLVQMNDFLYLNTHEFEIFDKHHHQMHINLFTKDKGFEREYKEYFLI